MRGYLIIKSSNTFCIQLGIPTVSLCVRNIIQIKGWNFKSTLTFDSIQQSKNLCIKGL